MAKTKGIRITDRDQDMLTGLYLFDGVLPERLVRQLPEDARPGFLGANVLRAFGLEG